MAPRATILIIIGIVIYVSLSLYHWRQVKNIPGNDKPKGVPSVLTRDSREKNWVQVSTLPSQPSQKSEDIASDETLENTSTTTENKPAVSKSDSSQEVTHPGQDKIVKQENQELQETLKQKENISQKQSQRIKELYAQIISLQSTLDETTVSLEEKSRALEKQKELIAYDPAELAKKTDADRIKALKRSLASKINALEKANKRITGLAERLDQKKLTIAELKDTNTHLEGVLAASEKDKIKTLQEAENLKRELNRTNKDKETYLAEAGRLHSELQQTKTRLAHQENELGKTQRKAEAMLRYGQEQTELITPFRQQIEILNARVEDKNRELLSIEDQSLKLIEQKKVLEKEIQALKLEQKKNETISNELKRTSQDLDKVREQSSELTEQLKVIADQLNQRDEMIRNLEKELSESQLAEKEAKRQSDTLFKEKEQQQLELNNSTQALAEAKQKLAVSSTTQQTIEKELEEARSKINQLNSKIEQQETLLKKNRSDYTQLNVQLEEKSKQLAAAKSISGKQQVSKKPEAVIKENKPAKDTALRQAEQTINQLKLALADAETRLAKTGQEMKQLNKALAEVEQKQADPALTNSMQEEIEKLKNTIREKTKHQENTEQALSKLEEKNRGLQEKLNAAEKNVKNTQELELIIDQKAREIDEQKESIATLQHEASGLSSELDQREKAYFSMQEEFNSLQEKFGTLQKERDALLPFSLDSDHDHVSDGVDKCPDTVTGAEVGPEGCEKDHDGDTVVDRLDLCPDSSGQNTIDSFGCPEGTPIILSGLYFSGGNTELSPASQAYLDKVYNVLELNKNKRFEVGGHTDSIGDIDRNSTVSRKRAEAVTEYLINKGINPNRLNSVGYGSAQPIDDNSTAEGRAANRRVELKLISSSGTSADDIKSPTATAEEEGLPTQ